MSRSCTAGQPEAASFAHVVSDSSCKSGTTRNAVAASYAPIHPERLLRLDQADASARQRKEDGVTATKHRHPYQKYAPTPLPIDEEIRRRWSPRAFADRDVSDEDLKTLLEAARWAPSSYNEQPWRFLVAKRTNPEQFERMLSCLKEKNREWARGAPVLMLTAASTTFARNGKENRHAYHDLGLAMGNLINQATAMDLYVHQMAGIDPDRAREVYDVPEDFDVVAGVAIGYLGSPERLDDPDRQDAETSERSRRALEETVFEDAWGRTAGFVEDAAVLA